MAGTADNAYLSQDLVLTAFDVENPAGAPSRWEVAFETTGEKWLSITIPFVGDVPHQPAVDT